MNSWLGVFLSMLTRQQIMGKRPMQTLRTLQNPMELKGGRQI